MSHDTTSWTPYIVTATSGRVLLGARVALFIDTAVLDEVGPDSLTPSRTAQFLAALEVLLSRYDSVVGRVPPVTHAYQGRSVVEVAHLPGAAGLAHHGRAGFAVGPAFLRESLLSFDSPSLQPFLHHVFGYEAFRNYIFPESFTPPFKYSCLEGPECWGWWNQGFVNIMGCLLCSDRPSGVGFSYFGHSSASFRAGMESHLLVYLARSAAAPPSRLTFEDVFLHERLPWAQHQSLDNLYSGILSQLFTCHGGARFLAGIFRCIPHLASRLPTSTADHATASENMMLACSAGAQCSLVPFFEGLGFPLRQEAKDLVPVLICACSEGSV